MARRIQAEPDVQLSREDAAALCGLRPKSLDRSRSRGKFPEPDGMIGRSPWWWQSTISAWARSRLDTPKETQDEPDV